MNIINLENAQCQFKVAIVISRFNTPITQALLDGALARLQECHFKQEDIQIVWVPGAVEIPLVAKALAKQNQYAAIITLGAVIRGETTHYDYVCKQVSDGCQQIMLEYNLPVIFGILTTENSAQAKARCDGSHSDKGRESVDCAMELVELMQQIA